MVYSVRERTKARTIGTPAVYVATPFLENIGSDYVGSLPLANKYRVWIFSDRAYYE